MSIDEKNVASRDYTKTLIEATSPVKKGATEQPTSPKKNIDEKIEVTVKDIDEKIEVTVKDIDEKIETATKDIDEKIKQSDWNQNDSTENDYIIGRTHWSEEGLIEVLPETTIDFVEENGLWIENILPEMLVEGTEYIVTWNDIEYTCLARRDNGDDIYIGNQALSDGWTYPEVIESSEPFLIVTYAPDNWNAIGVANTGTYTIKITYWGEIIHKIDNKYLPEMVGKNLEGQLVTFYDPNDDWNEVTVQAARGAEIFNDYEYNVAAGPASHAEGIETIAVNAGAHAENIWTLAFGEGSHAEGDCSIALGYASHAEGLATIANGRYQHVEGKNNIIDNEDKYLHIAGNGTDSNDEMRSNAHTLDWEGNAWFAGDVYVGSTSGTNMDEGSKKLVTEEYVNEPKNYIMFVDQVNGYNYAVQMRNGNLVSRCTISSIEVTILPNKTEYSKGEYLDTTGMVVTATCYDGNTFEITDYTYVNEPLDVGENVIEISYTEYDMTYTTSFKVIAVINNLINITVVTPPSKTIYEYGETFSINGMVIEATYQDGSTKEVTGYTYSPSGNLTTTGSNVITISYTENDITKTCTQIITVNLTIEDTLQDFKYTDNGNGTYTIIDWKGTKNGIASTEVVIPDDNRIVW